MMERVVHVASRLGAQCLESLAPLSAGRGRAVRRAAADEHSGLSAAGCASAAGRAADAAATPREWHDPGLARPLLVWTEWMRGSSRHLREGRSGSTQLAAAISRAWRCALRAFSSHFSSLSEGERHGVAAAVGPALAAAMHAQTDRGLRAATARVCLDPAHTEFMARAGVHVPEDLVAELAQLVDAGGDGGGDGGGDDGGDDGGDGGGDGGGDDGEVAEGDGGAEGGGCKVVFAPMQAQTRVHPQVGGRRKRKLDAVGPLASAEPPPPPSCALQPLAGTGLMSGGAATAAEGAVAAGSTALSSGPDPSEDFRAARRLTALSDEQLRAASPRELAETLREASRQQGLLHELAASLAQLQERAAQALGDKLP
jgi:hypothetical protein